jgi:YrbI family 3-deoxy-D-manno-octulosonate 8-phosphate phosphatase
MRAAAPKTRRPRRPRALIPQIRLIAFDFDGVFTDNTVLVSETGQESVRCWRGDGLGLERLTAAGVAALIVSREENPVVAARARKLAIPCLHGLRQKRPALEQAVRERGLTMDQVAYVGNDINDLECLEIVALPIVVQDAHPSVWRVAAWRTRAGGGRGAVREICDAFVNALAGGKTKEPRRA